MALAVALPPWQSDVRTRVALVYDGPGTSKACVRAVQAVLRRMAIAQRWRVRTIDARSLAEGSWRQSAVLLCIPGGRDLPYVRQLRGRAVQHISAFVSAGGAYFGSCAGAYFAASHIDFCADHVPQVRGRRPLMFFRGDARGPSQGRADFVYGGAVGVHRLPVYARVGAHWQQHEVFNRGGCAFFPMHNGSWPRNARVVAWGQTDGAAQNGPCPVAVQVQHGRGTALLWGAHPELCIDDMAQNGGETVLRRQLAALLAGRWFGGA